MMIGDGNSVFIDTNILVYASQIQSPFHQAASQAIQGFYDAGVKLWISQQVLREYLATLTRPQQFTAPLSIAIVIQDIRYFQNRFQLKKSGVLHCILYSESVAGGMTREFYCILQLLLKHS